MESNEIDIRDARLDELDEVSLLLAEAYQQYADDLPSAAWQGYLNDIKDVRGRLDRAELIVAETDGRLVGSVTLYLNSRQSYQDWPDDWAVVRLLAVLPDYRGRGIGRALMEECRRRCRRSGGSTIGLHTTDVMFIARDLYEHMGFVRAPEYDFHPRPEVVVKAYRLDL